MVFDNSSISVKNTSPVAEIYPLITTHYSEFQLSLIGIQISGNYSAYRQHSTFKNLFKLNCAEILERGVPEDDLELIFLHAQDLETKIEEVFALTPNEIFERFRDLREEKREQLRLLPLNKLPLTTGTLRSSEMYIKQGMNTGGAKSSLKTGLLFTLPRTFVIDLANRESEGFRYLSSLIVGLEMAIQWGIINQ